MSESRQPPPSILTAAQSLRTHLAFENIPGTVRPVIDSGPWKSPPGATRESPDQRWWALEITVDLSVAIDVSKWRRHSTGTSSGFPEVWEKVPVVVKVKPEVVDAGPAVPVAIAQTDHDSATLNQAIKNEITLIDKITALQAALRGVAHASACEDKDDAQPCWCEPADPPHSPACLAARAALGVGAAGTTTSETEDESS